MKYVLVLILGCANAGPITYLRDYMCRFLISDDPYIYASYWDELLIQEYYTNPNSEHLDSLLLEIRYRLRYKELTSDIRAEFEDILK